MPGYKIHIAGAVVVTGGAMALAYWLGVYRPPFKIMAMLAALSVLSAMFPDVDTDSKGRHLYYGVALLADVALIVRNQYRYAAFLGLCALLPAIGAHRGWTHTWWAALLIPGPVMLVPYILPHMAWQWLLPFYLAAVLGYFSHLLLDGQF